MGSVSGPGVNYGISGADGKVRPYIATVVYLTEVDVEAALDVSSFGSFTGGTAFITMPAEGQTAGLYLIDSEGNLNLDVPIFNGDYEGAIVVALKQTNTLEPAPWDLTGPFTYQILPDADLRLISGPGVARTGSGFVGLLRETTPPLILTAVDGAISSISPDWVVTDDLVAVSPHVFLWSTLDTQPTDPTVLEYTEFESFPAAPPEGITWAVVKNVNRVIQSGIILYEFVAYTLYGFTDGTPSSSYQWLAVDGEGYAWRTDGFTNGTILSDTCVIPHAGVIANDGRNVYVGSSDLTQIKVPDSCSQEGSSFMLTFDNCPEADVVFTGGGETGPAVTWIGPKPWGSGIPYPVILMQANPYTAGWMAQWINAPGLMMVDQTMTFDVVAEMGFDTPVQAPVGYLSAIVNQPDTSNNGIYVGQTAIGALPEDYKPLLKIMDAPKDIYARMFTITAVEQFGDPTATYPSIYTKEYASDTWHEVDLNPRNVRLQTSGILSGYTQLDGLVDGIEGYLDDERHVRGYFTSPVSPTLFEGPVADEDQPMTDDGQQVVKGDFVATLGDTDEIGDQWIAVVDINTGQWGWISSSAPAIPVAAGGWDNAKSTNKLKGGASKIYCKSGIMGVFMGNRTNGVDTWTAGGPDILGDSYHGGEWVFIGA